MEVGTLKPTTDTVSGLVPRATATEKKTEQLQEVVETKTEGSLKDKQKDPQKVSHEEMKKAITAVNKFLDYMTADLNFKYNDKVDIMQVQLISNKDHRVLREYPPKEFLEMVASIRQSIGIFLDKKM